MTVYFSEDHEWIDVAGNIGTVGITNYAQGQLGDIVFVELPDPGRDLTQGGDAAVVESVKAASDVFAPLDGKVTANNAALVDTPELVNSDAEGKGWFFKMTVDDAAQLDDLMDEAAYKTFVGGLD